MSAISQELDALELRARRREELGSVIAMAVPMVITTCTRMIMDVTDYFMISQLPGDQAQAALLPAQLFLWSYIVIGLGTVSIVATFVSQALGRGHRMHTNRIDERWLDPLADAVWFFARHETQSNIASQIIGCRPWSSSTATWPSGASVRRSLRLRCRASSTVCTIRG